MVLKRIEARLKKLKLSERNKKASTIRNKKASTIRNTSKNWKIFKKLDDLKDEEIAKELKNLQMESTVQSFLKRQERRRNQKEENYDSEEDTDEKRKLAEQINISKKFFDNYEEQRKHNKFLDFDDEYEDNDVIMGSRFGKKQKKDIKGMIKKILLYGGLPTLLVVSLGVLSNKKFGKGKIKKNIKVKVSEEEKRFKQVFVKLVKKMILKRKKELNGMKEVQRDNVIETNKRKINRQRVEQEVKKLKRIGDKSNNRQRVEQEVKRLKRIGGKVNNRRRVEQEIKRKRDLIADAALRRQLRNKLKINKSPSNPQQSVITPPSEVNRLELIRKRQKQKIPSKKVFIFIDTSNQEWSHEDEKNSNYYYNKEDRNIYNKKGKQSKYIYTEEDGLALRNRNNFVRFTKTQKLKKE
tara:strand:- start:864 stop:2093 length:1230 start_codon:yes stop_codon:yes gene_type:complete